LQKNMSEHAATPAKAQRAQPKRKAQSRERLLAAARKLFVERGFHATRPQDIAKEAEVGHGTFYLHFTDKRACFLAFVEQAREELDAFVAERAAKAKGLEASIEAVLVAIYEYSEMHTGVLATAMTDDTVIASDGPDSQMPLLERWGLQWAETIKTLLTETGGVPQGLDPIIVGQAIVGAIHQATSVAHKNGKARAAVVKTLTKFLARALRP
jgi:AcrR family transcriptional regulator